MESHYHIVLKSIIVIAALSMPCVAQDNPAKAIEPLPRTLVSDDLSSPAAKVEKSLINDGQSTPKPKQTEGDALNDGDTTGARDARLQEFLTGAKLRGQFTMDGKPLTDLQDETYEIQKANKLKPSGDTWAIFARIKYGEHDVVVPVPIQILWAGDTPVLTMNKMAIPGLGTFSARVVLQGNRYAGTWQHDDVGGHLFGTVEPAQSASTPTDTDKVDPDRNGSAPRNENADEN